MVVATAKEVAMPASKQATSQQDLLARLTDAGSEAVHRLGDLPGGKALVDTAQAFRDRLDELAARMRAIDPLEKRVTALEERVQTLEKRSARAKASPKPRPKTKAKTTA